MKEVCVVIPIHTANPSINEQISFRQCFRILSSHPIFIIAPHGLDLKVYQDLVNDINIIYIEPTWQSSLLNYNKLKTSRYFYDLFQDYEFLLTYELDAFIFRDDLRYWCAKGYDFIGAPWFEGYTNPTSNKIIGVGNSGFSLRNVQTARKLIKKVFYRDPEVYFGNRFKRWSAIITHPFRWLSSRGLENTSIQRSKDLYEDAFFCYVLPKAYPSFKIANIEDAKKFSFEVNARHMFSDNGCQLPMGCHAWWRYDLEFWKPFIEEFGYSVK